MTASDCAYDSSATVQDDSACSGLSAGSCEQCSSTTATSGGTCTDWGIIDGFPCSTWDNYNWYTSYGDTVYAEGYTANDACCSVGGGTTSGGTTTTTWSVVDANGGDTDGDGVCDDNEVLGCTTVGDCAYDSTATDDDGSCSGVVAGACQECSSTTTTSSGSCTDVAGWTDNESGFDWDCTDYENSSTNYCSWNAASPDFGMNAAEACCHCGGGSTTTTTTTTWSLVDVDGGDTDGNFTCELLSVISIF